MMENEIFAGEESSNWANRVFENIAMDVEILYVKNGVGKRDSKVNLKSWKKRGSDQRLAEPFCKEEKQVVSSSVMRSQLRNLGRRKETALEVTVRSNRTYPTSILVI